MARDVRHRRNVGLSPCGDAPGGTNTDFAIRAVYLGGMGVPERAYAMAGSRRVSGEKRPNRHRRAHGYREAAELGPELRPPRYAAKPTTSAPLTRTAKAATNSASFALCRVRCEQLLEQLKRISAALLPDGADVAFALG